MARVALLGHAKPRTKKTKARISKTLSDHAVANSWWDSSSLPSWLSEECYVQKIQTRLRTIKVSRNIGDFARFEALRRASPRGPPPTASEALAYIGKTSRW